MQRREGNSKKHVKIQIFGCGEFSQDIMHSHVLDDVDVEKLAIVTDAQRMFGKGEGERIPSFETRPVIDELSPEHAEEDLLKNISEINTLMDLDILFLTCEIGTDPCTRYISTLTSATRNQEAFSIAVTHTILPFSLQEEHSKPWISKLEENVDLFIFVPFDNLTEAIPNYTLKEGYQLLIRIVATIIKDTSNFIQGKGLVENPSFWEDENLLNLIRECFHVRVGYGLTHSDYMESVERALECSLLDFELTEARMVIITITGDLDFYEAEKMVLRVVDAVNHETYVLWELFPEKQNDGTVETLIIALK